MAFHVDCYTKAKGKAPKQSIPSKYESTCAFASDSKCLHGGKIQVGEAISWARRGFYAPNGKAPDAPPSTPEIPPVPLPNIPMPAGDGASIGAVLAPFVVPLVLQSVKDAIAAALAGASPEEIVKRASDAAEKAANLVLDARAPREIVIKVQDMPEVKLDAQHFQFEKLLKACLSGCNVFMAGPSGSGKTTAAHNVARALGRSFRYTGAVTDAYALMGYCDANGRYVRTQFREAWEHGGVFLWDEIDGSDPNATVAFNAALANGVAAFPDGMVERHKDCIIIAAANTWGRGATREYVGRNKLDEAFLKRFAFLSWDYDGALELNTAPNPAWTKRVQAIRAKVATKGLRVLVTPRESYEGAKLLASGLDLDTVEHMTIFAGMTDEQIKQVS